MLLYAFVFLVAQKENLCGIRPRALGWHIWLKAAMTCLSLTLISLVRSQVVTLQQLPGVDSVTAHPS